MRTAQKENPLEIHVIKENQAGVFGTLLDFPTSRLLETMLQDTHRYVWCHNHKVGNYTWQPFVLPLTSSASLESVLSPMLRFDFILPTKEFRRVLPSLGSGIHVIQLNELPPPHLDLERIKGRERYRLLSEADWLFEFETPGNDYGQLASPHRNLIENAIKAITMKANT